MKKEKLIVVSGPSGAGKTTLVSHLISLGCYSVDFSISATSRPARGKEKEGVDYHFISKTVFQQKIKTNDFVEYEEVYKGIYYGTLRSEIERIWSRGRNVIFDIDVMGGLNIKKQFPENTVTIFIKPLDFITLKKRLENRATEKKEVIAERLAKSKLEISMAPKFDYVIKNNELANSKKEIEKIVGSFLKI